MKLEFRRAEFVPLPGLERKTLEGTSVDFYLHDEVVLDGSDIASAEVVTQNSEPAVSVVLTEAGREKWARVTEESVGKPIAMLVDGELVAAPTVRAPITQGRAIITGRFTPEEAQHIADGLDPNRAETKER